MLDIGTATFADHRAERLLRNRAMEMGNGIIASGRRHVLNFMCLVAIFFVIFSYFLTPAGAYGPLDPNGIITIKWDVLQWIGDGYVAAVTMFNFQKYPQIPSPGWNLGWKWAKKEVIWSMVGARATDRGDCSWFKGINPHCCRKDPTIVGLLNGNSNHAASFQITVGNSGSTVRTVNLPENFTLRTPGSRYTCGVAKIVKPTKFKSPDGRRTLQAFVTWSVTCS